MKNNMELAKRILAMILTLCMMLSSMSVDVPGWFAAFAEEEAGEMAAPDEASVEEETGRSESGAHDEGSDSSSASHEEDSAEEKTASSEEDDHVEEESFRRGSGSRRSENP